MNELILVAVPGGTADQPVVRMVVVPRLSDAAGLALLGNWAERVRAPDFQPVVDLDGTPVIFANGVDSDARPDVWSAFFPPGATTVTGWAPDGNRRPDAIGVRRSAHDESRLQAAYGEVANSPGAVATAVSTFLSDRQGPPAPAVRAPANARRQPDFHEIVAGLRDRPAVLRALGLIIDLPLGPLPPDSSGQVRIRWGDEAVAGRSPATSYVVQNGLFLPAPGDDGSRITGGMVDLRPGGSGWRLATIDIDHSVSGLESVTGPVERMPAPRSGGLLLLRDGRLGELQAKVQRGLGRGADIDQEILDADDLLLGYRLDVRVEGRDRWFSISSRVATHHVNDLEIAREVHEDAHLKPHAVQTAEGEVSMVADEIVARWSGESIAAVGAATRGALVDMPTKESQSPPLPPELPFDYRCEVTEPLADTQLPLRFGQSYEMRARVADLAGAGVAIDGRVDSLATDPVAFLRHEPVPAPSVDLPVDGGPDLGPGGGAQTLVVRSDLGITAPELAAQGVTFPDNSQRVLHPPTTTPRLAELHGRLDGHVDEAWDRYRRAATVDGAPPLPDPMAWGVQFTFPGTPEGSSVVWPGTWPDLAGIPLRLEAQAPGVTDFSATDIAGAVVLRVPQGETFDLDVWSWLQRTDQPLFQMSQWVQGDRDFSGDDLVTPATTIRLIHAVRKPLRDPSGELTATRVADATTAMLTPTQPWTGVHRGSTAQLVATGSWQEWLDTPDPVAHEPVELPPVKVPVPVPGEAAEPPFAMMHDFGDTRRRDVTYTIRADGRYRDYFASDDTGEFTTSAALPTVVVPNSGIPAPVRITSAVPAFSWDGPASFDGAGEFRLTRRARRLRVELDGPWYSTGAGELLGVVFAPPGQPAGGLTEIARDPLWRTNIPQLDIASLAPTELPHPTNPATQVRVLGVPVWTQGGRWFADVMLPVTEYAPLVRLTVARYQPESVVGRHLSALTDTDFLPLYPDRSLTLRRDGAQLSLTLEGTDPGPGVEPLITATIEARQPGSSNDLTAVAAIADESAWKVRGPATGRLNEPISIDLPADPALDLRLVVREAEHFSDAEPIAEPDEVLRNRTTYLVQIPLQ